MNAKQRMVWLAMIVVATVFGRHTPCPAAADEEEGRQDRPVVLSDGELALWGGAPIVFIGRLDKADAGPVAESLPPIYSHTLHFTLEDVMRGDLKSAGQITGSHSARQMQPPVFPVGERCLVAAKRARGRFQITHVEVANDALRDRVRVATLIPLGWSIEDGKLVSPWAALGERAWPAEQRGDEPLVCARTARPALPAGSGVQLEVEPVPPKKAIKWTNPDGDGEYRITVTNPTDQPVTVPALRTDPQTGEVLWDESLVILCQDRAYPVPAAKGIAKPTAGTVLKPGQSISTTVNALALDGPEWPRGGYRIEFQFCLGELSDVQSFYYLSRHHDAIRKQFE